MIAGYTMVVDFSVPHESFYRPSVRQGAEMVRAPSAARGIARRAARADNLAITVTVDGAITQQASTANMILPGRAPARRQ